MNTYAYVDSNPLNYYDLNGLQKSGAVDRFKGRKDTVENISDLIDPPSLIWETPVTEGGCVIGPIYHYVWKCKNYKPPAEPGLCKPTDFDPDIVEVITTKFQRPLGQCNSPRREAAGFGLVCPAQNENVTTPPRHFLLPVD